MRNKELYFKKPAYSSTSNESPLYKVPSSKMVTSSTASTHSSYSAKLPVGIDVLSKANAAILSLRDGEMKAYTAKLLFMINNSLQKTNEQEKIANYLSRLNLVEQNDSSILVEWIFDSFRIGFTVETNVSDSSYFIVSHDPLAGSFFANTKKIGENMETIVENIVKFVLENT